MSTETTASPSEVRGGQGRHPRTQDLHVYYGNIAAVKGLSLTVYAGEIVTLIGSNGAGKSTTLRTISGLLRPRTGDVSSSRAARSTASPATRSSSSASPSRPRAGGSSPG